jgi:hypothetical protein
VSPRTEYRVVVVAAVALVLLRSAVPLVIERSFDSDQAIVGLMAKHLSELRTFPLFFYGQNYMLGVQAWIAAPFFWLGGPTIVMLRLPLLLINIGVVWALISMFRRVGLRPALGLVAVLPFAMTTPVMSDALLRPLGAAVEPFAWVLILWTLRRRPVWFGVVFCVGFLHREFVFYAAPALLIAQWCEARWWRLRDVALAAGGFAAMWLMIDLLKRSSSLYGPLGANFATDTLFMQPRQLALWLSFDAYADRVWHLVSHGVPDMLGARSYQLAAYHGLFSGLTVGSSIAGAALLLAAVIAAVRLATVSRPPDSRPAAAFASYLGVIGLSAIAAYGLNGGIDPQFMPVVRYALFVLLIPVALFGIYLRREGHQSVRTAVVVLICLWAGWTTVDATRVVAEYLRTPPDRPHHELADYLVRNRIRYARAGYWDAYLVTFLSREQVIVASTEQTRILAYGELVGQHEAEAVDLVRQPCEGARRVAQWCLE